MSRNLFFDMCAHDQAFLLAAFRQRGVDQMLFAPEAPRWRKAAGTGPPADDLVPVIGGLPELSEEDKIKVFNTNAKRDFPQLERF